MSRATKALWKRSNRSVRSCWAVASNLVVCGPDHGLDHARMVSFCTGACVLAAAGKAAAVDLARQAAMSTRNLVRHFTAATGATPSQWLAT
ncbi:hypothetical protein [Micromonospora sp. CNB394]